MIASKNFRITQGEGPPAAHVSYLPPQSKIPPVAQDVDFPFCIFWIFIGIHSNFFAGDPKGLEKPLGSPHLTVVSPTP